MANKKIKHVIAKLLGEDTTETLDIYDESALHAENIQNNLTTTNAGYALDARQGKALQDQINKNGTFVMILNASSTGTKTATQSATTIAGFTYILMCAVYNDQIMASHIYPRSIISNNSNRRHFWLSFTSANAANIRRCDIQFNNADLTSISINTMVDLTNVFVYAVR